MEPETRLTKKRLKKICRDLDLYSVPELNDVLYLHYQNLERIENLDEFTGLKALWLQNNKLRDLDGLTNQKILRCLYAHHNLITFIDGIENLKSLVTLNISHNQIVDLECLGNLINLETLDASYNKLELFDSLESIKNCKKLSCLNLSYNKIEDEQIITKIFAEMSELKILQLMGNPIVRSLESYKKRILSACPDLTFLDDRPVKQNPIYDMETQEENIADGKTMSDYLS